MNVFSPFFFFFADNEWRMLLGTWYLVAATITLRSPEYVIFEIF
jgi:hypothetical protein